MPASFRPALLFAGSIKGANLVILLLFCVSLKSWFRGDIKNAVDLALEDLLKARQERLALLQLAVFLVKARRFIIFDRVWMQRCSRSASKCGSPSGDAESRCLYLLYNRMLCKPPVASAQGRGRVHTGHAPPSHLPDQRLQFGDFGGQKDAERGGVRRAGDGTGDDGSSHGEGQHGVDDKHDEEEERHLQTHTEPEVPNKEMKLKT